MHGMVTDKEGVWGQGEGGRLTGTLAALLGVLLADEVDMASTSRGTSTVRERCRLWTNSPYRAVVTCRRVAVLPIAQSPVHRCATRPALRTALSALLLSSAALGAGSSPSPTADLQEVWYAPARRMCVGGCEGETGGSMLVLNPVEHLIADCCLLIADCWLLMLPFDDDVMRVRISR